jgi:lysozyme family protein
MANVKAAIDFVLTQEDATMTGEVTTLTGDTGGATRFGLASSSHPELVASGFFDVIKTPRDAALVVAEAVYNSAYAVPLEIARINDQAVATAVLSFGINAGLLGDGKLLQQACGAAGNPVTVDGHVGPGTLSAANSINPSQLLNAFSEAAIGFYGGLAAEHPQDAAFVKGWDNRVAAWSTSAAALDS